jgi:hypothetical protein
VWWNHRVCNRHAQKSTLSHPNLPLLLVFSRLPYPCSRLFGIPSSIYIHNSLTSNPAQIAELQIHATMSAAEVSAAQLEAANTLSRILTQQRILHAFIGGFGIRLLGSVRPTDDIDAMIDVGDSREIVNRIRPLLQEQDSRFSIEGFSLYFTSEVHQDVRVKVETVPVGTPNLPPRIIALLRETGIQPSSNPRCTTKANVILQKTSPCCNPTSSF